MYMSVKAKQVLESLLNLCFKGQFPHVNQNLAPLGLGLDGLVFTVCTAMGRLLLFLLPLCTVPPVSSSMAHSPSPFLPGIFSLPPLLSHVHIYHLLTLPLVHGHLMGPIPPCVVLWKSMGL